MATPSRFYDRGRVHGRDADYHLLARLLRTPGPVVADLAMPGR
jgi:hypothetical protein